VKIAMLMERASLNDGVSRTVFGLTKEFVRLGHTVDVYAAVNKLPDKGRAMFQDPAVRLRWLPSLRGGLRIWTLPLVAMVPIAARALIRPRRRPDVIVSHTMTVRQDIVHMHNDPQHVEHAKLSAVPFTIDPPKLEGTRRTLRAAIERQRFKEGNYRGVVAHSARSARELRDAFGIPEERISVIPHGVDSAFFNPALVTDHRAALRRAHHIGLDETVFLYLGDSWKGLEFAIRALAGLPKGKPFCLLAAGPYRKQPFLDLAASHSVRLIAQDVWDDPRSLYAMADAMLHPTPLDTFGLVALEAMSMRLPLATTRFAGISELLRDGENAFIVPGPDSVRELREAAAALLEPERRVVVGARAREFAVTRTWEAASRAHLGFYRRALGPAAGASSAVESPVS
jgi:glycosyltransferase involved in cell wall biosynthesis